MRPSVYKKCINEINLHVRQILNLKTTYCYSLSTQKIVNLSMKFLMQINIVSLSLMLFYTI